MINERETENVLEQELKELGWIVDVLNPDRQVYRQTPRSLFEQDLLKTTKSQLRPDFILYDNKQSIYPIAVIEVKKPNISLNTAKEQAFEYMDRLNSSFCFIYNKNNVLVYNSRKQPLMYIETTDGKQTEIQVNRLMALDELLSFKNLNTNTITPSKTVITSSNQLFNLFAKINDNLRNSGIPIGYDRFLEFSNLFFLKMLSSSFLKNHYQIPNNYLFESYCNLPANMILDYVNNTVIPYLQTKIKLNDKQDIPVLSSIKIQNTIILKEIMLELNALDLNKLDMDVKGMAFEYFMSKYNKSNKDLGEYFTPRHYVSFLNKILKPVFGQKVYDGFCGTGGMLIVSYKMMLDDLIKNGLDNEENIQLLNNSIYGSEISKTAIIAKLNLILSGCVNANIYQQNTFNDNTTNFYDKIISNIPFNMQINKQEVITNNYLTSSGNSMCIYSLIKALKKNSNALATIIVPDGFLSNKEDEECRRFLIKNNYLYGIVSLPAKGFLPYTETKTSVLILKPSSINQNIFYFSVLNDGYTLTQRRRRIAGKNDLDKFLEIWNSNNFETHEDIVKINKADILKNDKCDLNAHLYLKNDNEDLIKLDDLLELSKQKNKNNYPIASIIKDLAYGWKLGEEYWKGSFNSITTQKDTKNYNVLNPNEISYSPARINVGSICLNNKKEPVAVSTIYPVFKLKEEMAKFYDIRYIYFAIKFNKSLLPEINNNRKGTARFELKKEQFLNLKIPKKTLKEQWAIIKEIEAKILKYEELKNELENKDIK